MPKKPLPSEVKKLKDARRGIKPPAFEPGVPDMPKELSAEARKSWKILVVELADVLTRADRLAVETLATWSANLRIANARIEKNGRYVLNGSGSTVAAPWTIDQREALKEISKNLKEFGLTPAARNRVVGNAKSEEIDPFEAATTPPTLKLEGGPR